MKMTTSERSPHAVTAVAHGVGGTGGEATATKTSSLRKQQKLIFTAVMLLVS